MQGPDALVVDGLIFNKNWDKYGKRNFILFLGTRRYKLDLNIMEFLVYFLDIWEVPNI